MPTSVSVTTDKQSYQPGDPITITVDVLHDAVPKVYTYTIIGETTVDGRLVSGSSDIEVVFPDPAPTAPTVKVSAGHDPSFALTPHPTQPNTWTGVLPAA